MLNDQTKKILSSLKTARLTSGEKATIKAELVTQLDLNAAQEPGFSINYQKLTSYFVFAASVFALALASGAGLSQAAEGSLPGDWLYPIKTKIAEPVARVLISDHLQQFDLETEILEKRLHEAETLIKEEELDDDRKEQIKIEISKQAAKAAAVIQNESNESKDMEPEDETNGQSEEMKIDREDEEKKEEKTENEEMKRVEDDREQKLEEILEQHQETIEKLESKSDHKKSTEAKEKSVRSDDNERHNDRGRD